MLLELRNISKKYQGFSLKNISLRINKGDYFVLLGVSGAGKSLLLETIAGLVKPDSGIVLLKGLDITHMPIHRRNIGLVFQDHAVLPHLSVSGNILYPLYNRKVSRVEKLRIIHDISKNLGIAHLLNRKPATLSGGELQRVALARTLVQQPSILLLDEPLASLDIKLKHELRQLLRKLNRQGQTIIHVTHDYEETIALGNAAAVMHHGEVIQSGTPEEIFKNPKSEFVAHFTGAKNFFRVSVETASETRYARTDKGVRMCIPPGADDVNSGYVMIRSEDIFLSLDPVETSAVNNFRATVREISATSRGTEILADAGIPFYILITKESADRLNLQEGTEIYLHFKASAVRFIGE